jgi:hypothetical protein
MVNASIERLCGLVAPPASPLYNSGDWQEVERALGLRLPDDYKLLIETFGQGGFVGQAFCSGLLITSYLGARPVERATGAAEYFRSIAGLPYGVYPAIPGLLAFGSYGDKDTVAWNTSGPPDEWVIVYHDPETGFHEVRNMGALDLAVSVLEESSPLHRNGVIGMGNMKGPHTFLPEP